MTKQSSQGARDVDNRFCFGAPSLGLRSLHSAPGHRFCRRLIAAIALCFIGLSAPPSAHAGDKEFSLLVHYVESHYHAHRQYRFLLGFASFAVNVVRPYGVKGMKLAIWEDQNFAANKDDQDFPDVVKAGLADGWQPMVRVWSRRDGERTVIFAKADGKDMKLLVATVDKEDAVVVQMKINPDKLSECIEQWSHDDKGERHGGKHGEKLPSADEPI
jgi:hypothetical protein